MRIPCPFCGARGNEEFAYLGDASLARRPDAAAPNAQQAFHDYVYQRDNPSGAHSELWFHTACRSWLVVKRNTRTHAIASVTLARAAAAPERRP